MNKKDRALQYQEEVIDRFEAGLIEHFSDHTTKKRNCLSGLFMVRESCCYVKSVVFPSRKLICVAGITNKLPKITPPPKNGSRFMTGIFSSDL